jgi:predicted GNAT family acetyltransferase
VSEARRSRSDAANLVIHDVPEAGRYEARLDGSLVGWVDYRRTGSGARRRLVAIHTEVPPEFGGRGIGGALVRRVVADAREAGERISPLCPLFLAHFERHPEDADVRAP